MESTPKEAEPKATKAPEKPGPDVSQMETQVGVVRGWFAIVIPITVPARILCSKGKVPRP